MVGNPKQMRRKRSASATFCILDPGSVMQRKRSPAFSSPTACFTRSKKYCLKMLGSSVLPDLLETMKRVRARSILASKDLICAGSVESRTCNSGEPEILPNVMRSTSAEAGPAHAEQENVSEAGALDVGGDSLQMGNCAALLGCNVEPAQPAGL